MTAAGGQKLKITPAGPVEEAEVRALEQKLDVALPEPYRRWLLRTGGANVVFVHALDGRDGNMVLDALDGPDYIASMGWEWGWNINIPLSYLVVGGGEGTRLLVGVAPPVLGHVAYADVDRLCELVESEEIDEDGRTDKTITTIAASWDEFLVRYQVVEVGPEAEPEPEDLR